jgi:hypothetical protein
VFPFISTVTEVPQAKDLARIGIDGVEPRGARSIARRQLQSRRVGHAQRGGLCSLRPMTLANGGPRRVEGVRVAVALCFLGLAPIACARAQRAVPMAVGGHPPDGRSPGETLTAPEPSGTTSDVAKDVVDTDGASCQTDGGGRAGSSTLVRFVVRPTPHEAQGCKGSKELALEIPSLRWTRSLCDSSCGPFHFETRKERQDHASFTCEEDLLGSVGTVTIVDDVVRLEMATTAPLAFGDLDLAEPHEAAAPILRRESIPLPCGQPVALETSRPAVGGEQGSLGY